MAATGRGLAPPKDQGPPKTRRRVADRPAREPGKTKVQRLSGPARPLSFLSHVFMTPTDVWMEQPRPGVQPQEADLGTPAACAGEQTPEIAPPHSGSVIDRGLVRQGGSNKVSQTKGFSASQSWSPQV